MMTSGRWRYLHPPPLPFPPRPARSLSNSKQKALSPVPGGVLTNVRWVSFPMGVPGPLSVLGLSCEPHWLRVSQETLGATFSCLPCLDFIWVLALQVKTFGDLKNSGAPEHSWAGQPLETSASFPCRFVFSTSAQLVVNSGLTPCGAVPGLRCLPRGRPPSPGGCLPELWGSVSLSPPCSTAFSSNQVSRLLSSGSEGTEACYQWIKLSAPGEALRREPGAGGGAPRGHPASQPGLVMRGHGGLWRRGWGVIVRRSTPGEDAQCGAE